MNEPVWRVFDHAHRRVLKVPDSAIVHAAPRTVIVDIATFQLFRSSVAMNMTNFVKFLSKVCKQNIAADTIGVLNIKGVNVWYSRITIKLPNDHDISEWADRVFGDGAFGDATVEHEDGSIVHYLGQSFLWLWSPNKMRQTSEVRSANRNNCQCANCAVTFNQGFDLFPTSIGDETMDADALPAHIPGAEELPWDELAPKNLVYLLLTTDVYGQSLHDPKRCPVAYDSGAHPNWLERADFDTDEVQAAHVERAQRVAFMLDVSLKTACTHILKRYAARRGLPLSTKVVDGCHRRLRIAAELADEDFHTWTADDLKKEKQKIIQRNSHIFNPLARISAAESGEEAAMANREWIAQGFCHLLVPPEQVRQRRADHAPWLPPELWEVVFGMAADDALASPDPAVFRSKTVSIAQLNKLARATLYERAMAMLKPVVDATEAFVGTEASAADLMQHFYTFLSCCDALKLSVGCAMRVWNAHSAEYEEDMEPAGWFRLLDLQRHHQLYIKNEFKEMSNCRKRRRNADDCERIRNYRSNSLPNVPLARKPRALRVALNVDAARAPKSHALLRDLERTLLA